MAYATTTELAEYLGLDETDLPDDAERLLDRASEMIDYYTLNKIDTDKELHEQAAKKATVAQVEWWIELGDELGLTAVFNQISIGNFSAQTGGQQQESQISKLAPRAKQELFKAGLLNRGVNLR